MQLDNVRINFIEPLIYRSIIDDVMANIKREFDDYGVGEDVLSDLQSVSVYFILFFYATQST